jgi:hypothetical protein
MTLAEEKALLARFAKTAGAGEMLNIHDVKAAYEKAIGHATSERIGERNWQFRPTPRTYRCFRGSLSLR